MALRPWSISFSCNHLKKRDPWSECCLRFYSWCCRLVMETCVGNAWDCSACVMDYGVGGAISIVAHFSLHCAPTHLLFPSEFDWNIDGWWLCIDFLYFITSPALQVWWAFQFDVQWATGDVQCLGPDFPASCTLAVKPVLTMILQGLIYVQEILVYTLTVL